MQKLASKKPQKNKRDPSFSLPQNTKIQELVSGVRENAESTFVTITSDSHLYAWLALDEDGSQDSYRVCSKDILTNVENVAVSEGSELLSLSVELINAKLPHLALLLISNNFALYEHMDFDMAFGLFMSEGVACMLVDGFSKRAEKCFKMAYRVAPEEPAPYVNLAQLCVYQDSMDEAMHWCGEGFNVHPNHEQLWECFLEIGRRKYPEKSEKIVSMLHKKWQEKKSWLGCAYAYDTQIHYEREANANEQDLLVLGEAKAKDFAIFYGAGETSDEFLIEYTGILGACEQYSKIPGIIWQKKSSQKQISWQLSMHLLQAYLALEQKQEAQKLYKELKHNPKLPEDIQEYLKDLMRL